MYVLFDTPLFPDLVQCGKYMLILLKIGFVQVKKKVLFTMITQQNYKKKKKISIQYWYSVEWHHHKIKIM